VAYRKAAKGKRGQAAVAAFEFDLERNLYRLEDELLAQTYRPGPYRSFYIHDPKRRLVSARRRSATVWFTTRSAR
jgi:RNA-directed DNA polymerase